MDFFGTGGNFWYTYKKLESLLAVASSNSNASFFLSKLSAWSMDNLYMLNWSVKGATRRSQYFGVISFIFNNYQLQASNPHYSHVMTRDDFITLLKAEWDELEKSRADIFQGYPNTICFKSLQFCPSMALVGFGVFILSCSVDLSCYFDILVSSMTNWPMLKLPKIAWPSPFDWLCSYYLKCHIYPKFVKRTLLQTDSLICFLSKWIIFSLSSRTVTEKFK